ncbi:MAG: DUF3618 domain-containing protein [Acidothermaceae bacterium]
MPSDPEELLRSIERTREELARTVDTIAGRLDPKLAAKRGIGKVRSGVTSAVDRARVKLGIDHHTGQPVQTRPNTIEIPEAAGVPGFSSSVSSNGLPRESPMATARRKFEEIAPAVKQVPKPVLGGGLAALVALAAVLAVRRRRT